MRISDWSSDVCSSDLAHRTVIGAGVVLGDPDDAAGHHEADDAADVEVESGEGDAAGVHLRVHADHVVGDRPEDDGRQHGRGDEALVERAHDVLRGAELHRSEEHTSELQSLMRISYAVFCLKKKNTHK